MRKLIEAIHEIAQDNPNGFTFSLETLSLVSPSKGYSVALKETQNCFGEEGLKKVIAVAKRTRSQLVGGWKDGKLFYYDAVLIVDDLEEAKRLGVLNEQLAIWDFEKSETIYL